MEVHPYGAILEMYGGEENEGDVVIGVDDREGGFVSVFRKSGKFSVKLGSDAFSGVLGVYESTNELPLITLRTDDGSGNIEVMSKDGTLLFRTVDNEAS